MPGIVIGLDGSEPAKRALRWAAREAALRRERLVVVLGWRPVLDEYPLVASSIVFGDRLEPQRALESMVAEVLGADASDDAELHVVRDAPASALLAQAERASMLVVGARGRGGFASLLLGSVSQRCLHHAPCPIVVVRSETPQPQGDDRERIVVGVDGAPASDAALRWAIDEAGRRRATVDAVHVWHLPYLAPYPFASAGTVDPDAFEELGRTLLEGAVQRVAPTAAVNQVLVAGGAAGELIESAKGADLLVLGTRGFGAVGRFLLGSVSSQVSLHAPCSIVVVPGEA